MNNGIFSVCFLEGIFQFFCYRDDVCVFHKNLKLKNVLETVYQIQLMQFHRTCEFSQRWKMVRSDGKSGFGKRN